MKRFLENRFHWMRSALENNRQEKAVTQNRTAEVYNVIENIVDDTDSRIRLVPGYKKKLYTIIQDSLEYTDDLINSIPPPIEISSRSFISDPYVNAFFTNVPDMQSVFRHSSELQEYMQEIHDDEASCCALLCMRRSEKTVFGMELSGDMLRKDVRQTAVSFSEHRLYSPAPSEPEARDGLKNCLFQGLVTSALEHIVGLKHASIELQSRHQMLHSRLRHLQLKMKKSGRDDRSAARLAEDAGKTERELEKIEHEMMNSPALVTPQLLMDQVTRVFSKPEEFVRTRKTELTLNKMGIVVNDAAQQPCNKLVLTEARIGKEVPRVITLATIPKRELTAGAIFSN